MSEVCLIWSKGLKSSSINHLTSSKLSCCKSKTCRYRNSKLRNLTHHEVLLWPYFCSASRYLMLLLEAWFVAYWQAASAFLLSSLLSQTDS
ncbi:hypothetical protein QL285_029393 [Trifolium repens]|nr:hypothetical protein QL285_029393 [Trifolium repens]